MSQSSSQQEGANPPSTPRAAATWGLNKVLTPMAKFFKNHAGLTPAHAQPANQEAQGSSSRSQEPERNLFNHDSADADEADVDLESQTQTRVIKPPPQPRPAQTLLPQTPTAAPFPFSFTPIQVSSPASAQGSPAAAIAAAATATPETASPTALLRAFFNGRGDRPFNEVEMTGVMTLMHQAAAAGTGSPMTQQRAQSWLAQADQAQAQTQGRPQTPQQQQQPYTPIFSPVPAPVRETPARSARALSTLSGRRRPASFTSGLTASPFKRPGSQLARTGFSMASPDGRNAARRIETEPMPDTEAFGDRKRGLEDVQGPIAKRAKMSSFLSASTETDSPSQDAMMTLSGMTGQATAASMLAILQEEEDRPATAADSQTQPDRSLEPLKATMLNPYAQSAAAPSPRRIRPSPGKAAQARSAVSVMRGTPQKGSQAGGLTVGPDGAFVPRLGKRFEQAGGTPGKSLFPPTIPVETQETGRAWGSPAAKSSVAGSSSASAFAFKAPASTSEENASGEKRKAFTFGSSEKPSRRVRQSGFGLRDEEEEDHVEDEQATHMEETQKDDVPADDAEHARHGGFECMPSQSQDAAPIASAFSFGKQNGATYQHKPQGPAFQFQSSETQASLDSPKNVHKLRDGTEYVSPSKKDASSPSAFTFQPQSQETVDAGAASSAPTAFSYKPQADASAAPAKSAFSFGQTPQKDEAAKTAPPPAVFTFDASKKAEPISAPKPAAVATTARPAPVKLDDRARAAAVPQAHLQPFKFTTTSTSPIGDPALREKIAALPHTDLMVFHFTIPATPAPQTSTGFNWAAAGMAAPSAASGWSCDVCMVSNPADKTQCLSCETPKPGNVPAASQSNAAGGGGGGFDWAAAGMKPMSGGGWTCDVCMVSNPADKAQCLSCESPRA